MHNTRKSSANQQKPPVQIKKPVIPQPGKGASMADWGKFFSEQVKCINENLEGLAESSNFSCAQSSDTVAKLSKLNDTVQTISNQMTVLQNENQKLYNENQILHERLIRLECHQRRQNVVFEGIAEVNGETDKDCMRKVLENIKSIPNVSKSIKLSRCHRVGPYREGQVRSIKCHVHWFGDKVQLFKGRKQLKNGVTIHDDYPPEIEERRRILKPIMKKALTMDTYKNNTYLNVDRLIINSVSYTYAPINNLDLLPDDLNPRTLCELSDDNTHLFFGIGSPFSNFHSSEFVVDGTKYTCNEQYIQSQKASMFNDDIAESRIMMASSPYKMKAIGSRI